MKLVDMFAAAIEDAEHLRRLYKALLTSNQRAIRPEWARRFYQARLKTWAQQQGLWRSSNQNVLIVGTNLVALTHRAFQHQALAALLRSSLVLYMAAVDKVLHEALLKRFAKLAKSEALDDLVDVKLSKAYAIAQHARIRTGKGGKKRKRPGHALKAEMLADIYKDTYLKTANLEKVCAACGKRQIFRLFSGAHPPHTAQQARDRWSRLYRYRNRIAHECDMLRMAKPQRANFNTVNVATMESDMDFIKDLGSFLAQQLG
jgi:hypothetical protein